MISLGSEFFEEIDEDYCLILEKAHKSGINYKNSLKVIREKVADRTRNRSLNKSFSDEEWKHFKVCREYCYPVNELNAFRNSEDKHIEGKGIEVIRSQFENSVVGDNAPSWVRQYLQQLDNANCLFFRDTSEVDGIVEALTERESCYEYFFLWW